MPILYSALKNRSESLTDGNCITGLFKYINPVSPPHKKMKVAIILQIFLVGVCMAERRNKVTKQYLYYFNSLEIRAFAVLLPSASLTQCQVYSTEVKTS